MGVVMIPLQSTSKHKTDKKSKNSRISHRIFCVFPSVLGHEIFPCSSYSHHSQDSPLIPSHCSGRTGISLMLTLTNWFVSLFRTLLKVGQSHDILKNLSSVSAAFPTDNKPRTCLEKRYAEQFSTWYSTWKRWITRFFWWARCQAVAVYSLQRKCVAGREVKPVNRLKRWSKYHIDKKNVCEKQGVACDCMWASPIWAQWWFIAALCPSPSWGKRKDQHIEAHQRRKQLAVAQAPTSGRIIATTLSTEEGCQSCFPFACLYRCWCDGSEERTANKH